MTIVVHLTEPSCDGGLTRDEHVQVLRHPFAHAISDDGLASVLVGLEGLDPTSDLVVLHPELHSMRVARLAALIRRSQRRRATVMVAHGLGPLGADVLVDHLAVLLSDRRVELDYVSAWCRHSEALITDVVWTTSANRRWASLDVRDRLRARLPGRRVRTELRPRRHAVVTSRNGLITGLQPDGADVVVSGRDAGVIARTVEQLATAHARSVRVVESAGGSSVIAEVVISSLLRPGLTNGAPLSAGPIRTIRPVRPAFSA